MPAILCHLNNLPIAGGFLHCFPMLVCNQKVRFLHSCLLHCFPMLTILKFWLWIWYQLLIL
jgi:hypothetical protein